MGEFERWNERNLGTKYNGVVEWGAGKVGWPYGSQKRPVTHTDSGSPRQKHQVHYQKRSRLLAPLFLAVHACPRASSHSPKEEVIVGLCRELCKEVDKLFIIPFPLRFNRQTKWL